MSTATEVRLHEARRRIARLEARAQEGTAGARSRMQRYLDAVLRDDRPRGMPPARRPVRSASSSSSSTARSSWPSTGSQRSSHRRGTSSRTRWRRSCVGGTPTWTACRPRRRRRPVSRASTRRRRSPTSGSTACPSARTSARSARQRATAGATPSRTPWLSSMSSRPRPTRPGGTEGEDMNMNIEWMYQQPRSALRAGERMFARTWRLSPCGAWSRSRSRSSCSSGPTSASPPWSGQQACSRS